MKLSNKGRYGIRAIFDIAFHQGGKASQIRDIADRQAIPPRFLEQIFQDLKRAGLANSKRGPRGGYTLAKSAADIRIGDIIRALEGSVDFVGPTPSSQGDVDSLSVTSRALRDLEHAVEACLDDVTIEDLCERAEAQGIRRSGSHRYVYSI